MGGAQPNGWSQASGMSADGRYVLFVSQASNLVPGDTDGDYDAFVRDLRTGGIERVSAGDDVLPGGASEASISADGRYVAFTAVVPPGWPGGSDSATWQLFLRDRRTGHAEQLTHGTDEPDAPAISGNGRYIAYATRQGTGIHVLDLRKKTTRLITKAPDGSPADRRSDNPVISADGSTVGFLSRATNLLPRDPAAAAAPSRPSTPQRFYVWNRHTGRIQGASIDPAGAPRPASLDARLSPGGRYALFSAPEPNGPDTTDSHTELYVRDLWRGRTEKAARPLPNTVTTGDSHNGAMTADGRSVYFASTADNLTPGDTNQATDIFRRDLRTGRTERIDMTGVAWTPISLRVDSFGTTALFEEVGKVYARPLPRT
ncbi:hypothetical protein ADK38_34255 [Streptomyces varsoviensis]|uniref:Uncharacterized protein n=2 Tax=Streptomyces varsoviensis TaxID=67373 RepID=A0ABR5IXI3_9ACTN|nr:hypothetical protein ADK38_34255 [Streptomyces varsoviensis]